jgi:hypothetical protein
VQRKEARRGQEGKRNVEQPRIAAAYRSITRCVGQDRRNQRRKQDQPEVRRVVFPTKIKIGPAK